MECPHNSHKQTCVCVCVCVFEGEWSSWSHSIVHQKSNNFILHHILGIYKLEYENAVIIYAFECLSKQWKWMLTTDVKQDS